MTRLARIEGQVRGVAQMVRDDRNCIDVLTQLQAIQGALDSVALALVDRHVRFCLAQQDDSNQRVNDLMAAVGRMVRH
jgi:DNA-binding FrmR family transcriptional regulator